MFFNESAWAAINLISIIFIVMRDKTVICLSRVKLTDLHSKTCKTSFIFRLPNFVSKLQNSAYFHKIVPRNSTNFAAADKTKPKKVYCLKLSKNVWQHINFYQTSMHSHQLRRWPCLTVVVNPALTVRSKKLFRAKRKQPMKVY